MKLNDLIETLNKLKELAGPNINITLDDLYSPASLDVDSICFENRGGREENEFVLVIRS